jgi:hypothetical protein
MTKETFFKEIKKLVDQNKVLDNPQKGVSTLVNITKNDSICYIRGTSKIYLSIDIIFEVYKEFGGKKCTSNDLRKLKYKTFENKPCNITFTIMILKELNLW